jgi:hypothetical protein
LASPCAKYPGILYNLVYRKPGFGIHKQARP